jgi:hypothetical protein
MQLAHDLRVVGRGLRRAPGRTLLVVLTLGLAIGVNSATFSLVDRVALRPLPVEKPEELVMVTAHPLPIAGPAYMMGGGKMMGMDVPLFQALRNALSPMFTATALWQVQTPRAGRARWAFVSRSEHRAVPSSG